MLLAGEFTEQSAEGFIHGVKAYTAHKTARMGLSPLPNDANGNPNLNQSPLFQHTKRHLVRHQSHIQAPKKQLLPTIEKKKLVHTKLVRRVPKAEDGGRAAEERRPLRVEQGLVGPHRGRDRAAHRVQASAGYTNRHMSA